MEGIVCNRKLPKPIQNIKKIGKILIANKKSNFLSLKLILNLIFFINSQTKIKNGINNPICFIKNISGNLMWSIKLDCSNPVLSSPYVIVMNSLLLSHIKWGTRIIKNISKVIIYLKSNFLSFLINIK